MRKKGHFNLENIFLQKFCTGQKVVLLHWPSGIRLFAPANNFVSGANHKQDGAPFPGNKHPFPIPLPTGPSASPSHLLVWLPTWRMQISN